MSDATAGRDAAAKRLLNELFKQQSAKLDRCFYSARTICTRSAIRAHSIQNSRCLDLLVDATGHVIAPKASQPTVQFERVGRNNATTFTGLCSAHDAELFRAIDAGSDVDNEQHLFLIAYRSVLRELHVQMLAARGPNAIAHLADELGMAEGKEAAMLPFLVQPIAASYAFGLFKHQLDVALKRADFRALKHVVLPIAGVTGLGVSSGFYSGARSPTRGGPAYAVLNVFPQGRDTIVVVSAMRDEMEGALASVKELVSASKKRRAAAASVLAIERCENIVIAPRVWDALPPAVRADVVDRYAATVPVSVFHNERTAKARLPPDFTLLTPP